MLDYPWNTNIIVSGTTLERCRVCMFDSGTEVKTLIGHNRECQTTTDTIWSHSVDVTKCGLMGLDCPVASPKGLAVPYNLQKWCSVNHGDGGLNAISDALIFMFWQICVLEML